MCHRPSKAGMRKSQTREAPSRGGQNIRFQNLTGLAPLKINLVFRRQRIEKNLSGSFPIRFHSFFQKSGTATLLNSVRNLRPGPKSQKL